MQQDENTLIIVPTYNEVENILALYSTIDLIENIINKDNRVFILKRHDKKGIAKAYIDGILWGLSKKYLWFQQMDADLSHDPKYLLEFEKLKDKNDFIVASRYVDFGKVEKWGFFRRFLSFFGGQYLKIVFNSKMNDLTGGFNCWNRKVLEKIDLSKICSKGFLFQAELKYLASVYGFKWIEFPYSFKEREKGSSKLSSNIIIEGLFKPLWIIFKYCKIK